MQVLSTFVLIAAPSWGAGKNTKLTQALQWASTDWSCAVLCCDVLLPTYQTARSHNTQLCNVKPHQSGFLIYRTEIKELFASHTERTKEHPQTLQCSCRTITNTYSNHSYLNGVQLLKQSVWM